MTSSHGRRGLTVLSLGYTLELWKDAAHAFGDPFQGLKGCHEHVSFLTILAHSSHRQALPPISLADNFRAYPTNAYTPFDSWWRMFRLGLRIARETPIDLIQVREPLFNGSIGYVLSRRLRAPLNVGVYGTNPFDSYWRRESWFSRMAAPLARRILRAADGIQVDGTATARSLIEAGISPERVAMRPDIPGNLSEFEVVEPDPELRARLLGAGRFERLVLFVGRVDAQKNVGLLLEVAARMAADHPAVRFIVVGDGWQRRRLEGEARARGLGDRVMWTGMLPHRQVMSYMATCDVFALCSRYEGFAIVSMEAAMAGMPVVTTAVSGSDDGVVDGKTGFIVPIGDVEAFVNALAELIRNPGRAADMGRRGRRHVQSLVARYGDPALQARIWERVVSGRT